MNDTRIDAWVILFVTTFIFVMLACSGCKTTSYSSDIYLDNYIENMTRYYEEDDVKAYKRAHQDFDLWITARAYERTYERK